MARSRVSLGCSYFDSCKWFIVDPDLAEWIPWNTINIFCDHRKGNGSSVFALTCAMCETQTSFRTLQFLQSWCRTVCLCPVRDPFYFRLITEVVKAECSALWTLPLSWPVNSRNYFYSCIFNSSPFIVFGRWMSAFFCCVTLWQQRLHPIL